MEATHDVYRGSLVEGNGVSIVVTPSLTSLHAVYAAHTILTSPFVQLSAARCVATLNRRKLSGGVLTSVGIHVNSFFP